MFKIVLFVVVFCAKIAVCGSIHENIDDEKYLELGKNFDNVAQINIDMGNNIIAIGSGVIIDDYWILTAAHALVSSNKITINKNNTEYESVKIIPHKDFDYDSGLYDIGLVKFNKKFNLKSYPKISTKTDLIGKKAIICGYGTLIKANSPGLETLDLKIRAGTNIIDSIEDHLYICTMSKDDHTELEYIVSGGDSGGGLFIDNELIGINSCTLSTDNETDGSYDDQSGHTRVELFLDWIEDKRRNN